MLRFFWPLLPASLRVKYCRRVVVTGAESTGTSTLALSLAEALNCPYVPEYGREYTQKRATVSTSPWRTEELVHIAEEQILLEAAGAARSDNGWMVADTDALTTALWHERYFGARADEVDAVALKQTTPFAYILTADDIPFEADDIREGGEERHAMTQRFREEIAATGLPWMEAKGSREQRLADALAFLQNLA